MQLVKHAEELEQKNKYEIQGQALQQKQIGLHMNE
jgi:hypothetical protein